VELYRQLKGPSGLLVGPGRRRVPGLESVGRRLNISPGKYATVFRVEVYVILACAYEIQTKARPEKYVSICADSQAGLKALRAAKTTSKLVRHCQKALNDISAGHVVGLYWVPGHAGVRRHIVGL